MTKFVFADRYAEASLTPTPQLITSRQAAAERIVGNITEARILDLAGVYYSSPGLDLAWLREEFAQEDASFSLVNNERETRVLAAAMLGALVADEHSEAILAVIAGHVSGHRPPVQAEWLVRDASEALGRLSVAERRPAMIETKVVPTATTTLGDEIKALAQNDWPALLTVLDKMRTERRSSAAMVSNQTTSALTALNRQVRLLREESQMLWWLFSGHSRTLERSFGAFGPQQAALVGAVDLGGLTTATELGPVAAPAMLERVIAMAKGPKKAASQDLASAVDGLARKDLERLQMFPDVLPARLAPVTVAIVLARTIGSGAWHARFQETTGLEATISFEPADLAGQLYREHLLAQLL